MIITAIRIRKLEETGTKLIGTADITEYYGAAEPPVRTNGATPFSVAVTLPLQDLIHIPLA